MEEEIIEEDLVQEDMVGVGMVGEVQEVQDMVI